MKGNCMKTKFIILTLLFTSAWASEEHREHAAHVHGHAQMTLALSGMELELELESPAMNLVGFEHHPESAKDREKVNAAAAFLRKPGNYIALDSAAGCTLEKALIESSLLEKTSDSDHHDHHSDFDIALKYLCKHADKLQTVNLKGLFQKFPAMEEIEVQWLTDQRQSSSELDATQTMIKLK